MLSEHTAASTEARVSLSVLEETQRSPGVRQAQGREEASLQNTRPYSFCRGGELGKPQRIQNATTGQVGRDRRRKGSKKMRVSLQNGVGTALKRRNFKQVFCNREVFSVFRPTSPCNLQVRFADFICTYFT